MPQARTRIQYLAWWVVLVITACRLEKCASTTELPEQPQHYQRREEVARQWILGHVAQTPQALPEKVVNRVDMVTQRSDHDNTNATTTTMTLEQEIQLLFGDLFDNDEMQDLLTQLSATTTTSASIKQPQQPECHATTSPNATNDHITNTSNANNNDDIVSDSQRHMRRIMETHENEDCQSREFDLSTVNQDVQAMQQVLQRCRILVLRNVFRDNVVQTLVHNITQYRTDVQTGRISRTGTTTHGGHHFILHEDQGRVNYLLPQRLVSPDVVAHSTLLEILSHPSLLDDDLIVNHAGCLWSEPGAPAQGWHADARYLFENNDLTQNADDDDSTRQTLRISGQDAPPFAISMFTPLQPMTRALGPTEFCLGTAQLRGPVDLGNDDDPILQSLLEFESNHAQCPDGFSRVPLLGLGDVVLFDYMLTHRGGANRSPRDVRSLLFTVYSRKWYRDTTFDNDEHLQDDEFARLTQLTRFAVVTERTETGDHLEHDCDEEYDPYDEDDDEEELDFAEEDEEDAFSL